MVQVNIYTVQGGGGEGDRGTRSAGGQVVHEMKEGAGKRYMQCRRGESVCHLWVRPSGIWMACQNPAAAGAPAQRQPHQRGWPVGTWGWRLGWTAESWRGWWLLSRQPCAAPSWGHCALWSLAVAPPRIQHTCMDSCQQTDCDRHAGLCNREIKAAEGHEHAAVMTGQAAEADRFLRANAARGNRALD